MTIRERCKKLCRRFAADAEKGSAAIEFAMVAPVFFVLLMGTLEGGLMFFSQSALQNAVTEMGRQIRTGQAQSASMTQDQFRTGVCNMVTPLIACDGNLAIDVQAYGSYSNIAETSPVKTDGTFDPTKIHYITGNACDVVLVRAFHTEPIYTPILTWFLVNSPGDKHLNTAAAAFRNEPFTAGVGGC
ncbi:MAG TPA: TadE/TadG family type IV pilus assembly protein [Rhizomicrobium sp.]